MSGMLASGKECRWRTTARSTGPTGTTVLPLMPRLRPTRVQRFIDDPDFLSHVVRFDLPLLGDITGLRAVHLQCHIGTDTVSLARLGADMTGVDFSAASSPRPGGSRRPPAPSVEFVESDVYDAVPALGGSGLRSRLHGHRRALLAARHPAVGAGRRRPAPTRRPAVHPRGSSDAVGHRRPAARPAAGGRVPVLRARRADGLGRGRTYVETDDDLHPQRHPRVEPRAGRDRVGAARRKASRSPGWSSTRACRGTRCRVR